MAYRYTKEVSHEGLGKYRVISGTDSYTVEAKAHAQLLEWERKYEQVTALRKEKARIWVQKQRLHESKERKNEEIEEKLAEAEDRTTEAQQAIQSIRSILQAGIEARSLIDWDKLKEQQLFSKPEPKLPEYHEYPVEPRSADAIYQPELNTNVLGDDGPVFDLRPPPPLQSEPKYDPDISILDKVVKSRKEEKIRQAQVIYDFDYKAWEEEDQRLAAENQRRAIELFDHDHKVWKKAVEFIRKKNDDIYANNVAAVEEWNREAAIYQDTIDKSVAIIEERKAKYELRLADGIEDYCEMVLGMSNYPDNFPQDFDLEYIPETKILIVEYAMPAPEHLPRLKEIKFVKSKNEFAESYLSENELNRIYDDLLYQICLRSLYELFTADIVSAIQAISFNGWVNSIDRATGKEANACVLSIQVKKGEYLELNFENVDPKACFKSLKGIGSSKLHSLTPVAPVLTISREDKRFVTSREVESQLNEGYNLAAMDWEDFEHLIRQLFEQEFQHAGGEVKITRASRDAGVDAIAFDPDVIRGGKTVIQAKRYTNTVGVSAVRDLYGTVLNEGASKGILVTTSDYGPDSYEFAKGKPLVLLNGANLLNLLEKHGHKAKIDLKEAKTILASQL